MKQNSLLLGDMTVDDFLENYWQKQPCIFRQAFTPEQIDLLSMDEISGFALDENIESRLIIGNSASTNLSEKMTLQQGPFSVETLSNLPETNWTLLIQSIDLWHQKFNSLLDWVNFLPRWRLDDIMVSIAAPGGGVGPHRDQYDVFLLQTQGERHWQVSAPNQDEEILRGNEGNEILQVPAFKGDIDETLEAGDILYIPPAWRHWGVAKSLCITTSIGFRAPSAEDLLISLSDQLSSVTTQRFTDAWRKSASGESITRQDIEQVRAKISSVINDDYLLAEALGLQVTQPKIAIDLLEHSESELKQEDIINHPNLNLTLHTVSRMSYVELDDALTIFVNGETLPTKLKANCKQLIEQLCKHQRCNLNNFNLDKKSTDSIKQILIELVQLDAITLD